MRLLIFNLATDLDDPALGFTALWVQAIAARVERVHVVTMRRGRVDLPANVTLHSLGKERGVSEPRRLIDLYRVVARILRAERIDACFSHMNPLFTVLAAPLLRLWRVPVVTWYAHPVLTPILRTAHRVSARMVSTSATAYPYRTNKLVALGHGIDTELFAARPFSAPEEPPLLLCVGRLAPVKDHPTLLRAVARLREAGRVARVALIGDMGRAVDLSYVENLHRLVDELNLSDAVEFVPAVRLTELPAWYYRSTAVVNLTRTGSFDKVVLEAMSCGRPCIAANEGFRATLGTHAEMLLFPYGDANALASRLHSLLGLSHAQRAALGGDLRQRVVAAHGLNGLVTRLIAVLDEVSNRE